MTNRIPESDDQRKAEIQRRIDSIVCHAADLYDLMEPGMSIEIQLVEPPSVITPNQNLKVRRLTVTRPLMVLEIKR